VASTHLGTQEQANNQRRSVTARDFVHTGPGTLAGRYLRMFWQPVYYAVDLPAGRAVPIRIMSEDFTLYRDEGGTPHVVAFRCAHRGTQLSTGWVEGDCIRCFYHGWKYDGSGQCVEQPAEDAGFASKVKIKGYPTQEYLGMIFAYLGEGNPPALPRYPEFEHFEEGLIEVSDHTYFRRCNYFQNIENSLDTTHLGFVHRDHGFSFDGVADSPTVTAEESEWGITYTVRRPSGAYNMTQFGMPNVFHMYTLPHAPGIGYVENMIWWVPVDDEQHRQFGVARVSVTGEAAREYQEYQSARRRRMDLDEIDLAEAVLAGELRLQDVDPQRVNMITLQDHVAQVAQGRIADRENERLGRGDRGVLMIRKLWGRELQTLADGKPLTQWHRPPGLGPVHWRPLVATA